LLLPALDVGLGLRLFLQVALRLFLVIPEALCASAVVDFGYPFFFALDVKENLEEWSAVLRV